MPMYHDNPNRSAPALNTVDSYTVRAWPGRKIVEKEIPTYKQAQSIRDEADEISRGHIIEANLSNGNSFVC